MAVGGFCVVEVAPIIKGLLLPGGFCSDEAQRFSQSLATDAMARQGPPGTTQLASRTFQPCEGRGPSDSDGGVIVTWAKPTDLSDDDITSYYRQLGAANGWGMYAFKGEPGVGGRKEVAGTCVYFEFSLARANTTDFGVSLTYRALGHSCPR
jgi:hypothetical protein